MLASHILAFVPPSIIVRSTSRTFLGVTEQIHKAEVALRSCACCGDVTGLDLVHTTYDLPLLSDHCQLAARRGHLGALQWLRGHDCPWDDGTCNSAAYCGSLAVLQWARANGCGWNEETCTYAAEGGQLEVLQWAHINGCPWNEDTCSNAARRGNFEAWFGLQPVATTLLEFDGAAVSAPHAASNHRYCHRRCGYKHAGVAWFGLQPGATVLLEFDGAERRPSRAPPPGDKKALERVPIFVGSEKALERVLMFVRNEVNGAARPVSGAVTVLVAPGKKVDHMGIKVEMIGQIELYYDRGNHYKFSSLVRELDTANSLVGNRQFLFDFSNVDKPYESYSGLNVRLRYFVRVTITRNYGTITKDFEFAVQNVEPEEPVMNPSLKMEVGIEECLHIEFEYDKSKYHLRDVIIGK
ncbi:vacuolar protein sorting-associated protein 26-domain-containing protein, partial [Tribonema minus]